MILSTNFFINTANIDYNKLNSEFQLVRYEFPEYNKKSFSDRELYIKLIIQYKTNLDYPFYFHSTNNPAIFYVLYPKNERPKEIAINLFSQTGKPIAMQIDSNLKLHILVKLLLANYFYNQYEKENRICQNKFYVFGEPKGDYVVTAVELSLGHYSSSWYHKNDKNVEEFHIIPNAVDFVKTDKSKINVNRFPYFEKLILDNTTYFRQLQPSSVQNSSEIWHLKQTGKRADLDWYNSNSDEQKSTRGYITFQFQKMFVAYLNEILSSGKIVANRKEVAATKLENGNTPEVPGISEGDLPVKLLDTVFVLDNRLKEIDNPQQNINKIDFQEYIDLLSKYSSRKKLQIKFQQISIDKIDSNFNKPLLVLQDVTKEDFEFYEKNEENGRDEIKLGFLGELGFTDPKKELYTLKHIPKQTINVNTNQPLNKKGQPKYNEHSFTEYFDYQLFLVDKEQYKDNPTDSKQANLFENKLDVCFNELLLKHFIVNNLPVYNGVKLTNSLPGFIFKYKTYCNYILMYQNTLLYFDKEFKMQFLDLRKPNEKQQREELLKLIGIDWNLINEKIKQKYWLNDNQTSAKDFEKYEKKVKSLFLICSPNSVIEIEEPEERILFRYDLGEKRNKLTKEGLEDIWYDEKEKIYTVGSSTNLNMTVPKANKVRRLDIYIGNGDIKIKDLLETLSYKFVRNKQYTVYPYFFDLIRLHNEINW